MTDELFNQAMERVSHKDHDALRAIYEDYVGFVFHVVLDMVKQREAAEDITSEFFIRLYEKADQYRPGTGHRGYLATIARNMTIDYIRKNQKEQLLDAPAEGDDAPDNDIPDPNSKTPEEEVVSELGVEQALSKLKPVYRQIVTMKVLGDMTFKEISEVLNIPMGTVTWNYQDAIKQLRRYGYE